MSGCFLTSDFHIGHRLVAEHRGFGTTQEHDEALRAIWVRTVSSDAQVWVLGDLSAGGKASTLNALEFCAALPGEKHLVLGNHDPAHPMHRDAHKWQRLYMEVFTSVQPYARRRIHGQSVLLSHFPYEADRGSEVRYPQYRLPNLGEFLLHGHTHSASKHTSRRELHVGLDAWGMELVPVDTVAQWVQGELDLSETD